MQSSYLSSHVCFNCSLVRTIDLQVIGRLAFASCLKLLGWYFMLAIPEPPSCFQEVVMTVLQEGRPHVGSTIPGGGAEFMG